MLLAFSGPSIQLVPDGTLLIHLALILVMVAVLNATLLKPINRILAERDRRTKGRLSEAEETTLKVEQMVSDYEGRLREARAQGYALVETERSAAAKERELKLGELKAQIDRQIQDERGRLASQTAEAKAKLGSEAQQLAVSISSQILQRPVRR